MAETVLERLTQLEDAVRRASDALIRLRDENEQLRREVARLGDERKQVVSQIDAILKDIAKLDLGSA
jgi:phage shock protein A